MNGGGGGGGCGGEYHNHADNEMFVNRHNFKVLEMAPSLYYIHTFFTWHLFRKWVFTLLISIPANACAHTVYCVGPLFHCHCNSIPL